jgi:hypothetical protein
MDTNKFTIIDLLFIIAQKFSEKYGYAVSKTKLIKLAYLVVPEKVIFSKKPERTSSQSLFR